MLIRKCINCGAIVGIKLTKPFWRISLWGYTGTACNRCLRERKAIIGARKCAAGCHC